MKSYAFPVVFLLLIAQVAWALGSGSLADQGFKNCNNGTETDSCAKICPHHQFEVPFGGLSGKPTCDAQGACHCNMIRPPHTMTKFRPPTDAESNCGSNVCNGSPPEYPTVHKEGTEPGAGPKYCVCFSALKD